MRTSRLRRWLLRGALLTATATTPLLAGEAAHAEYNWGDVPPAVATPADQEVTDTTQQFLTESDEYNWG